MSTIQSLQEPVRNLGVALSDKRYILTLGTCGDGKSTFNNALIGKAKNQAGYQVTGMTMSFQMHPSTMPQLQDIITIDSPGLNDGNMTLENWIEIYNNWIKEKQIPPLTLVVLLIAHSNRVTKETCSTLCTLLSCVEKLEAKNFTVVFNNCPSHYTKATAIDFFEAGVKTLATSAQQSFFKLTESQVLLVKHVEQQVADQALVEKTITNQVVEFISEKLKEIEPASVIKQKATNFDEIMDKAGEVYRENLIKANQQIAELTITVQELILRISNQEALMPVYQIDYKILCSDGTTASYTGYMLHQKLNGKGIMKWSNGDQYEGKWKDGVRHGKGTMTFANRGIYKGKWEDGVRHGSGTMTYADGDVYEGEWKNDGRTNGSGTMTYANGGVYKGEWQDGVRHGSGTLSYVDGDVYKGKWKNGVRHGKGTLRYADGNVFKGEWKDDKKNGVGNGKYADGGDYTGDCKDNYRHGTGTMKFANGDEYIGMWQDNYRDGCGKMTFADGDVYEGEWKNDQRHGDGMTTFKNNPKYSFYKGNWTDDLRHGDFYYTLKEQQGIFFKDVVTERVEYSNGNEVNNCDTYMDYSLIEWR